MSATIDWADPAVSSFVASLLDVSPDATASGSLPSLTAAVQSMVAQNTQDTRDSMQDPLLAALPNFTYAMPVQVVILGVTVTLLSMLLVHLLFTIRYHAPLNRVNYALQTSATGLSLANVAAQLHIVMDSLYGTGRTWPFMFDYIEVTFPKKTWSRAERAAWLLLQGLNALATHSTHIQFLTMLFPSALEARLILGLLGPLALATAGLYFTALAPSAAVNDLGDAIRNTANSSLTLLYTVALFIWGLTLNRSRAWRAEGGTASFGVLALVLGVLGTAVNFVEIKEERMRWLPGVVTCILLWQSWVGFWWWVGAGMWTGEAEDVERRRDKRRRKEERRRRKREAANNAQAAEEGGAAGGAGGETTGARSTVSTLRRRFGRTEPPAAADAAGAGSGGEAIELQDLGDTLPGPGGGGERDGAGAGAGGGGQSESNSSTVSSSRPSTHHFYTPLVDLFGPFLTRLRLAHDAAAVAQAAKPSGLPDDVRRGWGIRALMMRGKKERGERRQAAHGRVQTGAEMDAAERRAAFELEGGARLDEVEVEVEAGAEAEAVAEAGGAASAGMGVRGAVHRRRRGAGVDGDEEWEDAGGSSASEVGDDSELPSRAVRSGPPRAAHAYPPPRPHAVAAPPPRETGDEPAGNWAGRGMDGQQAWWWRGLVGRWRLRDVSQW